MTARKAAFLGALAALPVVSWAPALARRSRAVARQQNAGQVLQLHLQTEAQCVQLQREWEEVRALADESVVGLSGHLDPRLILKRVNELAADKGVEIRIQQENGDEGGTLHRYSFSGEGGYEQVVSFLDQLERGDYRVRYESVNVMLPVEGRSGGSGKVAVVASFVVPAFPEGQAAAPEDGGAATTAGAAR